MSEPLFQEPYLPEDHYLAMETISPFRHEYAHGIMYAMHCESAADYLEMETGSPFRHEYADGVMYAMAGGSEAHQIIESNLHGLLFLQLRGRPCRVLTSNMKLKLASQVDGEEEFYYPDAMVCCDPQDGGMTDGHAWRARPSALFEIVSPNTRHKDEHRKRDDYLALPSLQVYVRLEQEQAEIVVERRVGEDWQVERLQGWGSVLSLPFLGVALPLAELYEGVRFSA